MFKVRQMLVMLVVLSVVGGITSASASALEFFKENGELIKETLKVVSLGGKTVLKGKFGATSITIECAHLHDSGTIDNGNGMGLGLLSLLYLGCEITKPVGSGCAIPEKMLRLNVNELLVTFGTQTWVEFTPDPRPTFFILTFEKCTKTELNGNYPMEGKYFALINNTNSSMTVNGEHNELKFAGAAATLEGEADVVEMEGGGKIKAE